MSEDDESEDEGSTNVSEDAENENEEAAITPLSKLCKNSSLKEVYRITPHALSHAGTETQPLPGATETTLTESLSRDAVNEPWPGTVSDVQESRSIHAAVLPLTLADTVTDHSAVHPASL